MWSGVGEGYLCFLISNATMIIPFSGGEPKGSGIGKQANVMSNMAIIYWAFDLSSMILNRDVAHVFCDKQVSKMAPIVPTPG